MFDFVDELVQKYEPEQKSVSEAMSRLGITTGLDTSTDQYGDQQSLNSIYDNITWAYRSIGFIASNLARVPWIYKKGDEEVEIQYDVFQDPNPMQTRYDFLVESLSRLLLQGEMFWELYRAGSLDNKVIALFPDWRSEEVNVIPAKNKYDIEGYKRLINGKEYYYPATEVFYLKYFNPYSPLRGMGPLRPARHAASTELNSIFYNKQFFKQGARPAGIITTEQRLTEVEQKRLEEYMKKKYQSVDQMHELMVLWGGLKFNPLNTMSMTDMQFKDLRLMNREEIIAAFGLSLEVLGLGEKTYQNVQFYRRLAWTETLMPLMEKFLAMFNKGLIEELYQTEGLIATADYNNIEALREERSKKVTDYDKGFKAGAITPNEMREDVFGKDPLPDPAMDATYIPIPGSASTGTDTEPKVFKKIGQKKLTYDERSKIWHLVVKRWEQYEPPMHTMMQKFFADVIKDVKKKIPLVITKGADPGVFFDIEYWKKRLAEDGGPIIFATMKEVADGIMEAEGLVFDPVHPHVRQLLGQRINNYSTFVSKTTEEHIKKLLDQTLQQTADMSIADQTRAIQKVFDKYEVEAKASRAELIARTETMAAANAGTQTALVQGRFLRKMWITSRDDRVRDSHQIDGQVVNVDEAFTLADGSQVGFPQDFNERCIIISTMEPKN